MNNKIKILIGVALLLILSQRLMIKLVYDQKITGSSARFLANVYQLKAGSIEDEEGNINIYLKDFLDDKAFADKLLSIESTVGGQLANLDLNNEKTSELIWAKLLQKAWLEKLAMDNDIEVTQEDVDRYIDAMGGQTKIEEVINSQNISVDEYRYFLIEPDILEAKVYNYLIANFKDKEGVSKIEEAYALLEAEQGSNWDQVAEEYGEDARLSDNSFWLSEEELIDIYEPIKEIEPGQFSKIIQIPIGYIIWHLDSTSEEDGKSMREVRGLFIYAKGIDDFFDVYLKNVNVKKIY